MAPTVRTIAALALLALCACRRRDAELAPALPDEDRATVGYAFLVDPAAGRPEGYHFVPPAPRLDLRLPVYPPAALAARAGDAHVVVRIVIDTEGRIADVGTSPLGASSSGRFAPEFRDAALRALRQWRFTPGRLEQIADGPDADADGRPDYRKVTRTEPVRVFYDVRFDFEIVSGEGRVRTSASRNQGDQGDQGETEP
jgi:TonB family protein